MGSVPRRWFASARLLAAMTLLGLLCLVCLGGRSVPKTAGPTPNPVRLVVLVAFDQMRADYLVRWRELFGEGGFQRLQQDGAWFQNCHYPYAYTFTAPGHASLLTGCSPQRHGIVANEWFDRRLGEVASVDSPVPNRYERVPPATSTELAILRTLGKKVRDSISPENLLAPTLADALKEATNGRAEVVSLSLKDRSAVLPAGRHPDACYWMDTYSGIFVTSSYYRSRPHSWVADFNRAKPADRWFGTDWTRLLPDLDDATYLDVKGLPKTMKWGNFPHPLRGLLNQLDIKYYQSLYVSPFGNEVLLDLARRAIVAEHLGQHEVPDLLSVSFSCNDAIGHLWGPNSQEVLDVTLRSDRIVKDLLSCLDEQVGRGHYLLALTADHGVCPLPEVSRAKGLEAGRLDPKKLAQEADSFLRKRYGKAGDTARWVEAVNDGGIYLNQALVSRSGLKQAEVEQALVRELVARQDLGIQSAYPSTQLRSGASSPTALEEQVRRSFYPDRSGDVLVVMKPYHILWPSLLGGTTHGTPHPYDTHVPLLVYGPGIPAGVSQEAVTPQAIAAILARGLEIAPPAAAVAPVPAAVTR